MKLFHFSTEKRNPKLKGPCLWRCSSHVRHNGAEADDGEAGTGQDAPRAQEDDRRGGHDQLGHHHLPRVHRHDARKEELGAQDVRTCTFPDQDQLSTASADIFSPHASFVVLAHQMTYQGEGVSQPQWLLISIKFCIMSKKGRCRVPPPPWVTWPSCLSPEP